MVNMNSVGFADLNLYLITQLLCHLTMDMIKCTVNILNTIHHLTMLTMPKM